MDLEPLREALHKCHVGDICEHLTKIKPTLIPCWESSVLGYRSRDAEVEALQDRVSELQASDEIAVLKAEVESLKRDKTLLVTQRDDARYGRNLTIEKLMAERDALQLAVDKLYELLLEIADECDASPPNYPSIPLEIAEGIRPFIADVLSLLPSETPKATKLKAQVAWHAGCEEKASEEIDRLRAERDELERQAAMLIKEKDYRKIERDAACSFAEEWKAESDRLLALVGELREGLESLAEPYVLRAHYKDPCDPLAYKDALKVAALIERSRKEVPIEKNHPNCTADA